MNHKESGQAILEIIIVSGLAIAIITAITITTLTGLRNSQFSQNQAQATKLAQEGLEAVRVIKENNCPVFTGSNYYWSNPNSGPLVWDPGVTFDSFNFRYVLTSTNPTSLNCRLYVTVPEVISDRFTREIKILNDGLNQKKITSKVKWKDAAGEHESFLVTFVTK